MQSPWNGMLGAPPFSRNVSKNSSTSNSSLYLLVDHCLLDWHENWHWCPPGMCALFWNQLVQQSPKTKKATQTAQAVQPPLEVLIPFCRWRYQCHAVLHLKHKHARSKKWAGNITANLLRPRHDSLSAPAGATVCQNSQTKEQYCFATFVHAAINQFSPRQTMLSSRWRLWKDKVVQRKSVFCIPGKAPVPCYCT